MKASFIYQINDSEKVNTNTVISLVPGAYRMSNDAGETFTFDFLSSTSTIGRNQLDIEQQSFDYDFIKDASDFPPYFQKAIDDKNLTVELLMQFNPTNMIEAPTGMESPANVFDALDQFVTLTKVTIGDLSLDLPQDGA